jgi:pyruvate ferredoxin oxidoreductase gamma subunit
MYRIRFHGRGGQGIKTASRILGTALFHEGYNVQDAPRYGAERRGAPIFAYVRAGKDMINERGIISRPDLVLVADDSLMSIPVAGIFLGLDKNTVLFVVSRQSAETWKRRLNLAGPIRVLLPSEKSEDVVGEPHVGATLAGVAARLLGIVSRQSLVAAIDEELTSMSSEIREANTATALQAYDALSGSSGIVMASQPLSAETFERPRWVESFFDDAQISAPAIHAGLTSIEVRTGLWRTMRPVIDADQCNHCWWICSTFCPDSAITVNESGSPEIDYDHCKGCMICVAKCPPHAIGAIPEHEAQVSETIEEQGA